MSYEAAPATAMLATHCCVCQRPLVDAQSVEFGIGPECRKRHGFGIEVDPAARAEANQLVHDIAADQLGDNTARLNRLQELGFTKLVESVVKGMRGIEITTEGAVVVVRAPYSAAMLTVPGRRWDPERRVNTFPVSSKRALWAALCRAYRGMTARSAKGVFLIA